MGLLFSFCLPKQTLANSTTLLLSKEDINKNVVNNRLHPHKKNSTLNKNRRDVYHNILTIYWEHVMRTCTPFLNQHFLYQYFISSYQQNIDMILIIWKTHRPHNEYPIPWTLKWNPGLCIYVCDVGIQKLLDDVGSLHFFLFRISFLCP